MIVAVGAVLLGVALPAAAQQQNFTVTFGGQMRVYGIWWDNFTDFADTNKNNGLFAVGGNLGRSYNTVTPCCSGQQNKDSDAYYFQRWRLYTTVESADKNAKVVWAIEVGDITWGLGGGASGDEFGTGINGRNGTSQGGAFGADGANVETKNLYLQFNIPWVPNANILLGAHNVVFMTSPAGAFLDDDAWGIQLNMKFDPVDIQFWTAKVDENARQSADDNDLYALRIGVNLTPDTRITLEGLARNAQCFARQGQLPAAGSTSFAGGTNIPGAANQGACVNENFGDSFWVGATAATKIGPAALHGSFVYGQRRLWSVPIQSKIKEEGYGFQVTAQVPIGPVATWWQGWYTSGDEARITGGCPECVRTHPAATQPFPNLTPGLDFSTNAQSYNLVQKSDKLPLPDAGASWANGPFIMEFIKGLATIGAPGFGSTHYSDPTGTYGVGGSATYSLTPALSIGGGIGYLAATEDSKQCAIVVGGTLRLSRCGGGVYGDSVIEFDAGIIWRYNPNLTITGIVGYAIPDEGDDAWGAVFRTQFSF
jgi:hypothetical protein